MMRHEYLRDTAEPEPEAEPQPEAEPEPKAEPSHPPGMSDPPVMSHPQRSSSRATTRRGLERAEAEREEHRERQRRVATLSGFSGNQTLTVSGRRTISNFAITHTVSSGSYTTTLTVTWTDGSMPTISIGADQTSDQFLAGPW